MTSSSRLAQLLNAKRRVLLVGPPGCAKTARVAAAAKAAGASIKLVDYVRFQLGEGIEKEVTDFAAEVAAAAGLN